MTPTRKPTWPSTPGIILLLRFEEGFRERPYRDTEGYPTIGYGFRIGPKGAAMSNYEFELSHHVGDVWLEDLITQKIVQILKNPSTKAAWNALGGVGEDDQARKAVLISMCFQMGIEGLAKFKHTLAYVAAKEFSRAAANMLKSKWALQTPDRARRHAEQMKTGEWTEEYGVTS